jgi:hypothetical protein
MGRPSFPFYPDDWMNDLGLRGCSPATRGVWADLLCMMHQGVPYGHLADAAGPIPIRLIASRCGITLKTFSTALKELEDHNVFSRTEDADQTIFSRRMVRDEHNRIARGQGGIASLTSHSVPRPKGILPRAKLPPPDTPPPASEGILSAPAVVPSFGPEEVKEEVVVSSIYRTPKNSFEEVKKAWDWYKSMYPGDVNEFTELRLFMGVMETPEDLAALRANLPLHKASKKWLDGFFPSSENFISKRMFLVVPKPQNALRREPTRDEIRRDQVVMGMELLDQIRRT